MKKLLAILLTLAMLVPMCGFAEESAPGATRTVIFLKDFNAKVLGADIDEAEEKAVNDFLDALRVIVYQQGTTSAAYEVTLRLNPGDSIQIHSQTPHDWVNNTNRVVKILTVHTPNPFVHGNEVVF